MPLGHTRISSTGPSGRTCPFKRDDRSAARRTELRLNRPLGLDSFTRLFFDEGQIDAVVNAAKLLCVSGVEERLETVRTLHRAVLFFFQRAAAAFFPSALFSSAVRFDIRALPPSVAPFAASERM